MVLGSRCWVLGAWVWVLSPLCFAVCAQAQQPRAQTSDVRFDAAKAYEHLRQIVDIGPRPAGSPAIAQTRDYITAQLKSVGLTAVPQAFVAKTPLGEIPMSNLVVTIPGERTERIAIAGHYDTKRFQEFRFVGANDGGSSAAFLIEIARVLASRKNALTVEIIFFDGEEATLRDWGVTDHTYGSQYYVDDARRRGTLGGLKALILVDMIGDRSQRFLRESSSTSWLTDIIWSAAKKRGYGSVFVDEDTPIEDDHTPFLKAGVPAADIIDLDYPAWHTPADTLDQTSAKSLQVVGDVVLAALPAIEARVSR